MDESSVVDESSVPPGRRKFSSRREFSAFVDESSVVHLPRFLVDESSVKLVDESSVVDESSDSRGPQCHVVRPEGSYVSSD